MSKDKPVVYRLARNGVNLHARFGNKAAAVAAWTRTVARYPLDRIELVSDGRRHGRVVLRTNRKNRKER